MNDGIHISGGTFSGPTAIGRTVNQHVTVHGGDGIAELRRLLPKVEKELAAAAEPADREQIGADIAAVRRELERPEPRPSALRSRWNSLVSLVGDTARLSGDVARIAEIIGGVAG